MKGAFGLNILNPKREAMKAQKEIQATLERTNYDDGIAYRFI